MMLYFFMWEKVKNMGKTVTFVDAVSIRLTEDDDFISSGQYALSKYLKEGKDSIKPSLKGTSLGDTIVEAVSGSLPIKMKKLYRFAAKPSNYIYGIPTSYLGASTKPTDIEGGDVEPPEGELPPEIDEDFEYGDDIDFTRDTGLYFPRIYTRIDASDLINKPITDEHRTDTEKAFKILGLNLAEVTKSFNEGIGDITNDYKYIFLNMGISINRDRDDPITGDYLYDYFNRLYSKGNPIGGEAELEELGIGRSGIVQRIGDEEFTQQLDYISIWKKDEYGVGVRRDGTLMKVGEYEIYYRKLRGIKLGYHYIRKQATADTVKNIIIIGLKLRHFFFGQTVVMDGDNENLTIPLDYAVAYSKRSTVREKLLSKSLHLTVTTLQTVKKKWYQRKFFKFVVVAVSVAINFFVPGAGLTLSALMQGIATSIVMGIVIDAAIGILIKIAIRLGISEDIILIIAVVVSVVFSSYSNGNMDYSKLFNAKEAMKILNQSFDAYGKAIQQKILQVQKDMNTFNEYSSSKSAQLEEAQKMLNTGVVTPTLELLASPTSSIADQYLGESPEEFYTRTMTTDVTSLTLDMVNLFLEVTTSLPKARTYVPRSLDEMDDVLLVS